MAEQHCVTARRRERGDDFLRPGNRVIDGRVAPTVSKPGSSRWIAALEGRLFGAPASETRSARRVLTDSNETRRSEPRPETRGTDRAPEPPAPLPRAIAAALTSAMEVSRSHAPEGRERLLTDDEARRFEALFTRLPRETIAAVTDLVTGLRGEASGVARAIFIRAVLARLTALSRSDAPVAVLAAFADKLRDLDERTMLARSTVLDLDSTSNDHHHDPITNFEKRGVIYRRGHNDQHADNDGLYQRFTASCGPTVIEMMLAQADPVFAFALHESNIAAMNLGDAAARFQERLLEEYGGISIGLPDAQLRARFHNALGRLSAEKRVGARAAGELRAHIERQKPLTDDAAEVLQLMRDRFQGFPGKAELADLRKKKIPTRDEGIGSEELDAAMTKLIGPCTGIFYRPTNPPWGFARGGVWRHVDAMSRALRAGIDIPFGISEPAHWMLASAIRGRKPNREFLVSDPAGGRTAWVTERDFLRGTFTRNQFNLCTGKERGYVDVIFLPEDGNGARPR